MSLYLIVFAGMVGCGVYEYRKGRTQDRLYWTVLFILGMMLCFRYAQGTDYYGYYVNYLLTPKIWNPIKVFTIKIHGEIGWLLLCALCRAFAMPFDMLVFFISLFEMWCIHRFVSRWCPLRTVALLLIYPTIYLTYAMSALRQGMVLLFFLGFMIEWFHQKQWKHYIIGTFVCILFHSSAVVFLVLFALRWITLDGKWALLLIGLSAAGGLMASWLLPRISSVFAFYASSSFSIAAIGERAVSLTVILYIFWDKLKDRGNRNILWLMLQIYLYGVVIYAFLMWNALISARFNIFFKSVELMLFTVALLRPGKFPILGLRNKDAVAAYLLLLTVVMYFKNINSYIIQGDFFAGTNVFNYPYFSIFDMDAVESWRTIPYDFSKYLN